MNRVKKRHWRMEVVWHDSTILQGSWRQIGEVMSKRHRRIVECHTVGFVLADDDSGMVLASSLHSNEAAGVVVIPKGQIISKKRLR